MDTRPPATPIPSGGITREPPPAEREPLGRNQVIAIWGYGIPLAMTFGLAIAGRMTGPEWASWAQVYVPVSMGTILGVAGALKAVQALKGGQ